VSDETELTGITPVGPEDGLAPGRGGGFLSSTRGKVLAIGCAIGALLLVAGVALVIILGSSLLSGVTGDGGATGGAAPTPGSVPATGSAPTTGSVPSTAAIQSVPDIENRDVFTPRDPFDVIAAPRIVVETASGSTSANDNTLVLSDITTEDGEKRAVLTYNGKQYSLAEGEVVPGSPWKVLKIYTNSVVMLFGDDRVTLSVGQGITK
jgi:type IV pilus biogenesis protein PilP